MNNIPDWAMPKLEEYKRLADSKWHMSDTVHYISTINGNGYLAIELGPKDREDIPGSWYWYSVGYVIPVPDKQEFDYAIKYHNETYVHVNGWEKLIDNLESDLKEYNQKMLRAIQKKVEQEIDSLPG